jgi:hypothetical protein
VSSNEIVKFFQRPQAAMRPNDKGEAKAQMIIAVTRERSEWQNSCLHAFSSGTESVL